MKTRLFSAFRLVLFPGLLLLVLALLTAPAARAQNVGIGTTAPTQKLDVDGNLRLRGLSGSGLRLPQVQADGTITVGSDPLFSSSANIAKSVDSLHVSVGNGDRVFRPVVSGGRLYVPTGGQLRIYNAQPTTPGVPPTLALLGAINLPEAFFVTVTTVNGRLLAVTSDFTGNAFHVVDVTNPAAPTLLSSTSNASEDGQAAAIVSKDNIVFISSAAGISGARLAVWDIGNPAAPVRLTSVPVGGTDQMVLSPSGNTLYVADNQDLVLRILNVSYAPNPTVMSTLPLNFFTGGIALNGTSLYLTDSRSLHSYDVTNGTAPRALTSVPGTGGDLAIGSNSGLLVDPGSRQLLSFDLTNPLAPVLRGAVPAPSRGEGPDEYPGYLATDGTYAYVGIDFGGRIEVYTIGGTPRVVVVGLDGSLGTVPAPSQPAPSLSLSGQTLSIGGGNSVTLPVAAGDNLGNHLATQNLNLAGFRLVGGSATAPSTLGLHINSTGNVGLGLPAGSSPLSPLHVYSSSSFDVARLESNSVGPHLQFTKTNGGTGIVDYIGTDYTGFRAGALELRGSTSVQISGDGDPSNPDLVVAANGNVGIGTGTSAPVARLDVNGAARVRSVLSPTTGSHSLLPVAYGAVGGQAASLSSTDNYTVARVPGQAAGAYRLTFSSASGLSAVDLTNTAVTTTLFGTTPGVITYRPGTGYLDVFTFNLSGAATDRGFSFSMFLP